MKSKCTNCNFEWAKGECNYCSNCSHNPTFKNKFITEERYQKTIIKKLSKE